MKRTILFIICGLMLACCAKESPSGTAERLRRWDEAAWNRNSIPDNSFYTQLLDSIRTIDVTTLSREDEAFYKLLSTYVTDKAGKGFESDSTINLAIEWYSSHDDPYNLARAYLYLGIVRTRIDDKDTATYAPLKSAEQICDDNSIEDRRLKAMIYSFLGSTICYQTLDYKSV